MSSNRRNHPLSSPTRRSYWGQYWILGLVWIACTGCLPFALGQDTLAPSDIEGVKVLVKQAEDLFKEKKFGESAKAIETCNASFVDLVVAGAKKDLPEWERLHRKLARAAEVLAIEGAEFEPLPEWSAVIAKVREMESGKSKPDTKKPGEKKPNEKSIANGISFSKGVAPILVEHCGRCHVDKASGGFAMPDYQGLIKGSKAGVVLFPGDPDSSPLVDAIQSGTMPPNGNKVPADKLAVIKAWVKQGAQYDGEDPKTNLRVLTGGEAPKGAEPSKAVEVMNRTGKETISFANDVAPILVANCNGCHYAGNRPSGGLNFTNFNGLLKGGTTGPAIAPKQGKESLLVKKLLGEAGQRMPAGGRPALKPEEIETITKWIDEGATFDGDNRDSQLDSVIAKSWAAKANHKELMDKRMSRARDRWKIVSPTGAADEVSNEEFQVIGNVGQAGVEQVLAAANAAAKSIRKQFKINSREPLVRGGVTIYALKSRYDYSELGKMMEKRGLPPDWSSHWKRDVLDLYVAMIPDKSNSKLNESALVQQLTSAWMASHEGVPKWFADGSGRSALATAVGLNDERVKPWMVRVGSVVNEMKDIKPFMEGKMNDEEEAIVGFALVRTMQSSGMKRQYDAIVKSLANGGSFDESFQQAIGPVDKFLAQALGKKK